MLKWKKMMTVMVAVTVIGILPHCTGTVPGENVVWAAEEADILPLQTVTKTSQKPAVRNGWYTLKDGVKKRYYKNGEYLTGMRKVHGEIYYFNVNGIMQKGWKTINGKRYYFKEDGVRCSGLEKIGGKYYFFNQYGVMQTGIVKSGKTTYYLLDNGVLEAEKVSSTYYYPNGKAMSKADGYEYETLQTAKKIAASETTSGMTKSEKLQKCFNWVMYKYYVTRRQFAFQDAWPALYANDHFLGGGGDCFSDACAFAYLAKALGYKNIYVCVDTNNPADNGHAWTEIEGLVYDPLFAQAKSYSGNYGVRYGVYKLSPLLKKKIA